MAEELWALGYGISENTVAKLMHEQGLIAKDPKKTLLTWNAITNPTLR